MVAGRREGTQVTRGYALGLDCSLQGPSKLTATGTGQAWGTAKSGGNFYNGFLYILFFASVNLRWFFFWFVFSGFLVVGFFFSISYLAPLPILPLPPTCAGVLTLAARVSLSLSLLLPAGHSSPTGSGLAPQAVGGCPPGPGTAGAGEAAPRKTKRN